MSVRISKEIEFCAAHRLPPDFPGKCRHLHGHGYVVEVVFEGEFDQLDKHGILIDFGQIKQVFKEWIDANLDHAYISGENARVYEWDPNTAAYGFTKVYQMPETMPSSAECLAYHLFAVFGGLCKKKWPNGDLVLSMLREVTVWETPTSKATCTAPRVLPDFNTYDAGVR